MTFKRFRCHVCRKAFKEERFLRIHLNKHRKVLDPFNQSLDRPSASPSREKANKVASCETSTELGGMEDDSQLVQSFQLHPQNIACQPNSTVEPSGLSSQFPFPETIPNGMDSPPASTAIGRNVAWDVFAFYESFSDSLSELYPNLSPLVPSIEDLHACCRDVLSFCARSNLTIGESVGVYNLLASLEQHYPEGQRHVSKEFESASRFSSYLTRARKWKVRRQGWLQANIITKFGLNSTGVLKPVLNLMLEVLRRAGGIASVVPFQEEYDAGVRVFSSPCNSEVIGEYDRALKAESVAGVMIIGIEKYFDGHILSNSGSQSANNVRIRFCNIKGESDKWHNVGISPWIDTGKTKVSDARIREEKFELMHRFEFLLLKEVVRYSHIGLPFEGRLLFPRLVINVFDQKQERSSLSLRGAGAFMACTPCLAPSRFEVRKRTDPSTEEGDESGSDSEISADEYAEDGRDDYDVLFKDVAEMKKHVFEVQISGTTRSSRNVVRTLEMQLLVASTSDGRRCSAEVKTQLRNAKKFLKDTSAKHFPPSIASFAGLGSHPHRLFKSVGFDKLHVVEHGILRQLPDDAFKAFTSSAAYSGIEKTAAVSIANQRMLDIPRSARLSLTTPFRTTAGETQAGISGKHRREMAPFLWYAVMGIPLDTKPDDDPLLQALLKADFMHRLLMGINQDPKKVKRSNQDIERIQIICFEAGREAAESTNSSVNTKLHRIMYHVADHFRDFGCLRKGATDTNETLHKETKAAYTSTNRHISEIAPQLLAARTQILFDESRETMSDVNDHARLLITRNPFGTSASNSVQETDDDAELFDERTDVLLMLATQMQEAIKGASSAEEAEGVISKAQESQSNGWKPMKSVSFEAQFEWWPDQKMKEVAYAGETVFKTEKRKDAIMYKVDQQAFAGIIQAIFQHRSAKKGRVLMIRRLKEVDAEEGNRYVVEKFQNKRFCYAIEEQDVVIDCVASSQLLRLVMLVPDPYLVSRLYGPKQRMSKLPDTAVERKRIAFFEVAGYKFTDFPEMFC